MTDAPTPLNYHSRNGTVFRTDNFFQGKILYCRPEGLSDALFAADCIEFGGFHGTNIWPTLPYFQGYDTTRIEAVTGI